MRGPHALAVCLALLLAAATPATAQSTTATLRGRVVDGEGTALPGVPVTVNSPSRGEARKTVMTDIQGNFKFQLLPPANDYTLSVAYPGFAPTEVGPIDLDPGKITHQDVTLRTKEELTQRVEVVAHGSIVDTQSTKTSTVFNTEFIEGLPIIGRNYQDILTLTPGVTDTDGDGNPNVQGARATGLQYRLDGGNITDPASGTFGQNLNLDAIEEIEVITSGASAEYGRADGGFANLITKSGGNDFQGSFKLFWRSLFLDGDGASENVDTFYSFNHVQNDLRRLSPYLTLGGAIKKDHVWYFVSLQYLDRVDPLSLAGATIVQKVQGRTTFGKITWQVNADNKLAVQYNDDPYTFHGLFLNFGTDADSDAVFRQGGQTPQLKWTSILSPTLLMETLFTHFDSGIGITPVSRDFHVTPVVTTVSHTGNGDTIQALYPLKECSRDGTIAGFIPNCDPTLGKPTIYQINTLNGTVSGPYPTETDDQRRRESIKTDLTYTLEDAWGEHQFKSGFEFADETYGDQPINNPLFINQYEPCRFCTANREPNPYAVQGVQVLSVPTPVKLNQRAVSFNSSAYITDSWKPKPNVTIQAGARIDREDIDSSGFTYFNPRTEKRRMIGIVAALCADGERVAMTSGQSNADRVCEPNVGFVTGNPPVQNLVYTMDEGTPERLRRFDRNEDGIFDSGSDGAVWTEPFTTFVQRRPENFAITNTNLSPRLSVAWDPMADGKSKVFATWGRYFDRLFLDTVRFEQGPDSVNYTFLPDPTTHEFLPGMPSGATSTVSVHQIDRNLRTPFTDTFTLGFERELAPEWSARVTFTQRLAWNLLQDTDLNHILCTQERAILGVDPATVCPLYTDGSGKVHLSDDLFGTVGTIAPNKAPDLYNVNPNFNQILRIGNYNASVYRSVAVEVNKRLHRNWQMQASYTYSRAQGNAEDFASRLGNDPATADDERGYLDYDQRHRVVLIAVSQLPRDVEVGSTLRWEGGTPYSVIAETADQDNLGNVSFRRFFPTHQRNDQRNGNQWDMDLQLTKRFVLAKAQAAASMTVQNIFNMDDASLSAYRVSSASGIELVQGPLGLRRFGRIWELSVSFSF